jgi:hypothetical protein
MLGYGFDHLFVDRATRNGRDATEIRVYDQLGNVTYTAKRAYRR